MKWRPISLAIVSFAIIGAAGFYANQDFDPTRALSGIRADSVNTELWSADDGRNYAITTFIYSGPNIELSRKALEESLKNSPCKEQFAGDDYAYFAPKLERYVHDIGWAVADDGTRHAVVKEYCPLTSLKMQFLCVRLQVGVNLLHGSTKGFSIVDTIPPAKPEHQLMAACISGDVDAAKAVVKTSDTKSQDFLLYALLGGHTDVAQVLLDNGANINFTYPKSKATTVDRLAFSGHPEAVQFAFDHGAHFGDDGHTALANLTHQGSPADSIITSRGDASIWDPHRWENAPKIAEIYFAHGAKPNGLDSSFKQTPLALAAWMGNAELVKVLLHHGADPNISVVDLSGKGKCVLPLELARKGRRNQWREVVDILAKVTEDPT